MAKEAKFCPKCGTEQPEIKEEPAKEVEVIDDNQEENVSDEGNSTENVQEENAENNENNENVENYENTENSEE